MSVTIDKECMVELASLVAQSVVEALEKKNIIGNTINTINNNVVGATASANANAKPKTEKTAYQKTEQLLYNYRGFQKIVQERLDEIEDIKKYGVPQSCGAVGERVQGGTLPGGIVLPEESVEQAVHRIHCAIESTVRVIALMDRSLELLKNDPYYKILEMRYFDNRTLEDIAAYFNCDSSTVSRNRSRLVKELSLRLFPDDVVNEYMK